MSPCTREDIDYSLGSENAAGRELRITGERVNNVDERRILNVAPSLPLGILIFSTSAISSFLLQLFDFLIVFFFIYCCYVPASSSSLSRLPCLPLEWLNFNFCLAAVLVLFSHFSNCQATFVIYSSLYCWGFLPTISGKGESTVFRISLYHVLCVRERGGR